MKSIDILLVVPPFSYGDLDSIGPKCPNIGISLIASYLEQNSLNVKILDAFALDLTFEQIKEEIIKVNPKIVFTGSVTASFRNSLKVLEMSKEVDPGVKTIIGGPHVTNLPETAITKEYVDYVVIGEGEETSLELANFILGRDENLRDDQIKGIYYMENGEIKSTEKRPFIEDLNSLPIPAYHLLPMDKYNAYGWYDVGRKFTTMITSRGCPFKCSFCISAKNFEHLWRHRSAEKIFEEIKVLYEEYGVRHIYFQDDEFCVSHKRVIELCNMIIDSKMDLVWECLTRVNHVDDELLSKMAEAGCKSILYGVEVGYEEGFKKINKPVSCDMAYKAVKLTQKNKILTKVTFIMGFPWESAKELKQTIKFAKRLDADITFFNTLNPYPGSYLYEEVKQNNLIAGLSEEDNWEEYISHGAIPVIKTKYLSDKQLAYWNGRAYLELYLRPKFILRKLKSLTNITEFKRNASGGGQLMKLALKKMITGTQN